MKMIIVLTIAMILSACTTRNDCNDCWIGIQHMEKNK